MTTNPRRQPGEVIRVLVADDSELVREILVNAITQAPGMEVVGQARTGLEAVHLTRSLQPGIIAMDVTMPVMDGLEAARMIMQEQPTPIVMLGMVSQVRDTELIERATAVGALQLCQKPQTPVERDICLNLIKTLRAMSSVSVVRISKNKDEGHTEYPGLGSTPKIVFIVTSTGGPHALARIIRDLPPDFPLPIVIVQHISDGFVDNMTNWLKGITPLQIKMAEHDERPQVGTIYFAPIGVHLRMTFNGKFSLEPDTENYRHVPSGDVLLESAARAYGASAIGIVLTGMGVDGAQGLAQLRQQGAHTIVQDEATSIVFGMPKAAIELGGGEYVVPLDQVSVILVELANETGA